MLHYCYNFPHLDLPGQESDRHHSNTYRYHKIASCVVHGRRTLDERKNCFLCLQDPSSVSPAKVYTINDLFMMETYTDDFHTSFYIPEIKI